MLRDLLTPKYERYLSVGSVVDAVNSTRPTAVNSFDILIVASRLIIRTFYEQMRMRNVPVFHGTDRGFALEC